MRKRNTNQKDNKTIFIVILGTALLIFLFKNTNIKFNIDNIMFPIQQKIYILGENFSSLKDYFFSYNDVQIELENLKKDNLKVQLLKDENNKLSSENEKLAKELKIKAKPKLDIKIARINFKDHRDNYDKFYIDLGSEDGIEKDMIAVIGDQLIGKIGKVYDDYSIVNMITKEDFSVSAVTESGMFGVTKGVSDDYGQLYFEPATFEDTMRTGEKVYTSGLSDIYPKDLYIGRILEITTDSDFLYRSIVIDTGIQTSDLINVGIIKIRRK